MDNQTVGEGKHLFIKVFQLTNEKIELKYHHFIIQIIEDIINKFISTNLAMDKWIKWTNALKYTPKFLVFPPSKKQKTLISDGFPDEVYQIFKKIFTSAL